jgi:16S rRNA processing protein RimM
MEYFNVGKIVNTHGIKGELKVLATSDFAEMRLKKGGTILAFSPDGSQQRTLVIQTVRMHKNMFLLTFKDVQTMTEAELLKQWQIKIDRSQLHRLPEGEYYFHEIIGCVVVTEEHQVLGEIVSVLTPGANHVWVVQTNTRNEILLPVIDDVVLNVDVVAKRVTVRMMEGLI